MEPSDIPIFKREILYALVFNIVAYPVIAVLSFAVMNQVHPPAGSVTLPHDPANLPLKLLIVKTAITLMTALLSGFIAERLSGDSAKISNAWWLAGFLVLLGFFRVNFHPVWLTICELVCIIPACLCGYFVSRAMEHKAKT